MGYPHPHLPEETAQEETLYQSEKWFSHLVNAVKDYATFALDAQGCIATWNAGAQRLKGYTEQEIIGQHFSRFYAEQDRANGNPERSLQTARTEGRFADEGWRVRKDGTLFWANVVITPIWSPTGELLGFSKVTRDVSERKRLEEEKEALLQAAMERADRDPLTSLFNHRTFHHRLRIAAERVSAERASGHVSPGTCLAVAVFDMDNFKFFNDTYGHLVGDEVLCLVADALRSCCRDGDVVARIGGDEFAILLPNIHRATVLDWEEKVRATIYGMKYCPLQEAAPVPLGLSVGVALYPEEAATPADVLYLADKRAIRDKTMGDRGRSREVERLRTSLSNEVDCFSMLDALVTAVDNKDRYTRRHSEEVMAYASLIAVGLGLSEEEKTSLQIAALVHDVGKIGVPNRILRRPGALSEEEFEIMRRHTEVGDLLVAAVPELAHTLDAVRYHHERWDGGGYPSGLSGEGIPRAARILAVADAYSAMTMDRPYRKGLSPDEAASRLRAGAGQQWEAVCVEALLQGLERDALKSSAP